MRRAGLEKGDRDGRGRAVSAGRPVVTRSAVLTGARRSGGKWRRVVTSASPLPGGPSPGVCERRGVREPAGVGREGGETPAARSPLPAQRHRYPCRTPLTAVPSHGALTPSDRTGVSPVDRPARGRTTAGPLNSAPSRRFSRHLAPVCLSRAAACFRVVLSTAAAAWWWCGHSCRLSLRNADSEASSPAPINSRGGRPPPPPVLLRAASVWS